jgi:DnaK suppressor protein
MAETTSATRRAQLQAEHDRLTGQLHDLGLDRDSFDEGFADSGQVTAERGEVEALVASLLDALEDVDHALGKLDTNGYGLCESCGDAIAEARLQAMPTARMCIACASKKR